MYLCLDIWEQVIWAFYFSGTDDLGYSLKEQTRRQYVSFEGITKRSYMEYLEVALWNFKDCDMWSSITRSSIHEWIIAQIFNSKWYGAFIFSAQKIWVSSLMEQIKKTCFLNSIIKSWNYCCFFCLIRNRWNKEPVVNFSSLIICCDFEDSGKGQKYHSFGKQKGQSSLLSPIHFLRFCKCLLSLIKI